MKARINALKHKLMRLNQHVSSDGFGGQIVTFEPAGEFWAGITPYALQGVTRSKALGQRLGSLEVRELSIEIIYRKEIALTKSCRVEWQGQLYAMACDPIPLEEKGYSKIYACQIMSGDEGGISWKT